MKTGIHPKVFSETHVVCNCGNTFSTRSTKEKIHVEVCSKCHPYFTGEHRFIDTKGRVEDFQKKQQLAQQLSRQHSEKKMRKKNQDEGRVKSLKELLSEA